MALPHVRPSRLVLGLAVWAATAGTAGAQPGYRFDAAADPGGFVKMFVPYNSSKSRSLTLGPDGATFLLASQKSPGNVGARADVTLTGDFQVSVRYEFRATPDQVTVGYGAMIGIAVNAQGKVGETSVNRGVYRDGGRYRASRNIPLDDGKTHYAIAGVPTQAARGRLAIRRIGTEAVLLAADDEGSWVEFKRYPFTDKPVRGVRIYADTGGAEVELGGRLYDLQIRTGADVPAEEVKKGVEAVTVVPMPSAAAVASAGAGPTDAGEVGPGAETPQATPRGGRWLPVTTGLVGLAVGVVIGRVVGRRRPADPDQGDDE